MVAPGVKGRPQACVTCHRRKKGCDLQRPSCGQCRKACIPCGGYTRTAAPSRSASRAAAAAAASNTAPTKTEDDTETAASQPLAAAAPYMSPAPSSHHYHDIRHSTTPGSYDTNTRRESSRGSSDSDSSLAPTSTPAAAAAALPSPAPTPIPMISYPDLSGSLSLQPKYPTHFSTSTSDDDKYAIYSPATSFTYYASNQLPVEEEGELTDVNGRRMDQQQRRRHHQHHHQQQHQRLLLRQHHNRQYQQYTTDLHQSNSISSSAHHERIIGLFWEVFLPNSRPLPTKSLGITLGGAVGAIGAYEWQGDVLRRGLLAMAMTTVGKKQLQKLGGGPGSEDAERLRREGIRHYGKALQQMSQTLGKGTKWTTEHWVTTRLFNLYEALYGADLQDHLAHRASWKVHSEGDIAFITSKPPTAYITDPAHTLFTAGRHHLVLFALFDRKRFLLAEPAWKWVPWTQYPKSPRDLLIDILVDIPAVYEATDTIQAWPDDDQQDSKDRGKPGKKETARRMIRQGLSTIITRLEHWHAAHGMPIYPPSLDHPPPVQATPDQYLGGHVMTLFWATCIRLHNNDRLHLIRPELGEVLDPRIDPDECCRNIVNVVRVFVQPAAGICRQHFTVYPMSTALHHLVDVGPNRLVAERASLWADLNKPHCILIKRFLLSIEPPKYRNEEEAKLGP